MFQDIPESLIEKARQVLRGSEETQKRPDNLPITEAQADAVPETTPADADGGEKETKTPAGETITFNPEIRPDVYTEPYKVQPTT